MKKRTVFIIAAFSIYAAALVSGRSGAHAAQDPFTVIGDFGSASSSDNAMSPVVNPVFADAPGTPMLSYRILRFNGERKADHLAALRFMGFSLVGGWLDSLYSESDDDIVSTGMNCYNISKGFLFDGAWGFGLGYSFGKGRDAFDNYRAWSAGFLLRPAQWISLGAAVNDIGAKMGGENIRRREVYSLSLRPRSDRLTLSADAIRYAGENPGDLHWSFAANLRIFNDISFFAKADTDLNSSFGITAPLYFRGSGASTATLDYHGSDGRKDAADYNSFGLTLSIEQGKSAIPVAPAPVMLTLRIEREFMEVEKESFFGKRKISLVEIMEGIRQASTDRTISGLILEINYCGLGFAQIQELREEIRNFRSSGKSVHAVITAPGNREYYLASSADRIYYSPNALFTITGLSANVYFFKSLMAKVGIRFESISHGKYKSAFESFTREGISDEARENLTAIVKDLNEQFLTDISQERKLSPEALDAVLKGGGITPEEARALNFIDEISYYDAALEAIDKKLVTVKFGRYIGERKRDLSWGRKPAIAVIHVGGNIVRGGSSNSALGASTGDRTYEEMLTRSFSDESVAALVIRVSSGGGSAIASDLMQRRLIQLQNKFRKPVVFSFGDIAASGGYYIACTENTIIADRGSITGSIGVISGKLTLRELYEKLGVSKETIKMSDLADIYSESKDLTPEERAVIQKGVDYIYDQFTGKVMEYRGIPAERIPAVAEGRVFTGSQALPKGLVDRMGGLVTAIELAAEKGAISREYELQILPDQDSILSGMLESDDLKAVKEMIRPLIRNYDMTRFGNERALYIMPYRLEIE